MKQVGIYQTVYERQLSVSENECFGGIQFGIGLENLKNTNIFLNFSHLLMLIDLCFEGSLGPFKTFKAFEHPGEPIFVTKSFCWR